MILCHDNFHKFYHKSLSNLEVNVNNHGCIMLKVVYGINVLIPKHRRCKMYVLGHSNPFFGVDMYRSLNEKYQGKSCDNFS